ncbi:hypothetical protein VX037_22810 [Gordonia sp. Z-3]|uniref:hypothetical protein n=1 Tax=unclassified Gordonia (in: high G+C Gram-positive bacteria) TaxID=2657482 RepID=UPI002E2CE626|nr:hypothetical protein [Gordonia sp. Z-3]MED5803861.1 hypothetical protein [Gordonia sp. Z-3]
MPHILMPRGFRDRRMPGRAAFLSGLERRGVTAGDLGTEHHPRLIETLSQHHRRLTRHRRTTTAGGEHLPRRGRHPCGLVCSLALPGPARYITRPFIRAPDEIAGIYTPSHSSTSARDTVCSAPVTLSVSAAP